MKGIRGFIAAAAALGVAGTLAGVAIPAEKANATGYCASDRSTACAPATQAKALVGWGGTADVPPAAPAAAKAGARATARDGGTVCGPPFVRNLSALGPVFLPRTGYLGRLLRGYVRYGGLSTVAFLYRYRDFTTNPQNWRFPPDLGFAHSGGWSNGLVLRARTTLHVGALADRFGGTSGGFLAPGGTSFPARALPPDSLNTNPSDPTHLCNYHLYRVSKSFDVDAGPAAPAFQQPGGGRQYVLVSAYVPGAPNPLTVQWLLDNGYFTAVY